MDSDVLEFEKYEDNFHKQFDEIELPFEPQLVVTVQLLRYKRHHHRFFDFVLKPSLIHFIVSCPKVRNRHLKSFHTHDISSVASGLAKLISTDEFINQTFKFVVPKEKVEQSRHFPVNFQLDVRYNPLSRRISGKQTIDASSLPMDGSVVTKTIFFEHAKLELTINISKTMRTTPDFRYSLGLSQAERDFRKKRIPIACEAMKKILGEEKGPRNPLETPVVSVVGSGGGFRAIEGMCGAMEALKDSGLLDMITYNSGLSGSAWYFTSAYALQGYKEDKQEEFHEGLRYRLQDNAISAVIRPRVARAYENYLKKSSKKYGQIHTFANYFPGYTIGKQLLTKQAMGHLSDIIPYVKDGSVPYPILVAIQVKNRVLSSEYHTLMERTPHEISIPSYGINIKTKDDASSWYHGFCVEHFREFPLHFTVAMVGCAFAVLVKSYIETGGELDKKLMEAIENQRVEGRKKADEAVEAKSFDPDNASDDDILDSTSSGDRMLASDDEVLNGTESDDEILNGKTMENELQSGEQDSETSLSGQSNDVPDTSSETSDELDYEMIEFPDDKPPKFTRLNRATIKEIEKKNPQFLSRNAIVGRTVQHRNFALGLDEVKRFSLNPLIDGDSSTGSNKTKNQCFGVETWKYNLSTQKNYLSIADAGVLNNVAANVVLRPQRTTDLVIVMDFNAYESDESFDYQPILTAAAHAWKAGIEIPKVSTEDVTYQTPKELLIFPSHGPNCPTILWFTLCNKKFRNLKDYVPKSTAKPPVGDTKAFNDFNVFGKGNSFDTLKFYSSLYNFDQLRELMYHNVYSHAEEIKSALAAAILRKRERIANEEPKCSG